MPYLTGVDRREVQLLPPCVDDFVGAENEVRLIDAFVDQLDLVELGLEPKSLSTTGRPPYAPADLLKLFLWGYENRVVSSRRLERECGRNLELIWLMRSLRPDHWTICAFRRKAGATIGRLIREFNLLGQELGLIEGKRVVIDGTKLKASNNPARVCKAEDVAKKIVSLEEEIESYLRSCSEADAGIPETETVERVEQIQISWRC
jgi:transposase